MSTALRVSTPKSSRRVPILAAASGLVAAASIAITLAVAGGGSEATPAPPVHAHPDRATLYQRHAALGALGVKPSERGGTAGNTRAAERFHHFR